MGNKSSYVEFRSEADGKANAITCVTLDLVSLGMTEFHGGLPLEVDGKPEFTISVDNPKKEPLGLQVDNTDPAKLFVIGVKKGTTMHRYNEKTENKVAAGCFIVNVTGADAGSASKSRAMEKILKENPEHVDLVCRRAKRFCIPVTLPEEGDMGLEVRKQGLGDSILITSIHANGGVAAWNADNPEQIVEPWDRIVAVDGKAGKAADLKKLLKNAKKAAKVVLTIVRIAC